LLLCFLLFLELLLLLVSNLLAMEIGKQLLVVSELALGLQVLQLGIEDLQLLSVLLV
jgi:hypothetical protein